MLSAERIALLKYGAPPRNALEAALRNAWGGGGASYEKTVGPAPILSISDAKAKPAKSLVVGMEPVQDLHGYDSPWPAGGGKNKWALGDRTVIGTEIIAFPAPIPVGNWTFSCEITSTIQNASALLFKANADGTGDTVGVTSIEHSSGRVSNSFGITTEAKSVIMYSANAWNESQGQTTTFTDVQFEAGTTATSYAPYSNECPITGRTGVTVERTGKNLFDATSYPLTSGYINSSDGSVSAGGTSASKTVDYIPCRFFAGETITINHRPGYGYSPGIAFYDADKTFISGVANNGSTSTDAWSMSVPSAAQYMRITVPYGQENIQGELGSPASD